jgi:glycosyltransferase involved in cell wall biosynthesis
MLWAREVTVETLAHDEEIAVAAPESELRRMSSIGRSRPRDWPRLLILAQLPPPTHGASIMNQTVVESKLVHDSFDVSVIPLRFSRSIGDLGKPTIRKAMIALQTGARLIESCLSRRPDLAYFTLSPSGWALWRDLAFAAILRAGRIPVVFHIHGRGLRSAVRSSWARRVAGMALRNSAVIVLGEMLREEVAAVADAHLVRVIPNGVPDRSGEVVPRSDRDGPPRVLFLSNMIPDKGVFILLEALGRLRSEGVPFKALLVGPAGYERFEAELRSALTQYGLGSSVEWVGARYGTDKADTLARADLLVFPSHHSPEALPLVILEAMAYSLPVVATTHGAIPEVVMEGKSGFLISPRDAGSLAERLKALLLDEPARLRMGEYARRRYEMMYTTDLFLGRLLSVFGDVREGRVGRRVQT